MVRPTSKSTVSYQPADPSMISTVPDLVRFLREEQIRIAAAIAGLADGHLDVTHAPPDKPRDGDIRYADGTDWDPGGGRGVYYFNGDALTWVQIG